MTWRMAAAAIIRQVIAETGTHDLPALRRALHAAYPYRERRHWPYKVWCDEVRRQLGRPLIARPRRATAQGELCV
ncbi:MAG TPA: hypothetical protein P5330_03175 [Candidatus Competibacteraceae bacterium]|nr:hypothetical protein [Candidatus Competibacteraceae bacterium]